MINNQCTHAGGIVFRRINDSIEYLLIGPGNDRLGEWLFPKGHIELGEARSKAALREVLEETGVCAHIIEPLTISSISLTKKTITVQYFLMEMTACGVAAENRRKQWVSFEKAMELLTHEANKILLQEAEGARRDKTNF